MSKRNRVNPFGELVATSEYGTLMGNRGALRSDLKTTKSQIRWITCLLEYKSEEKDDGEPKYTKLFFLDEATAFAAGHRPCSECQGKAYKHFKDCWIKGNSHRGLPRFVSAELMDGILQSERINLDGNKVFFQDKLGNLPDGTMIVLQGDSDTAGLVWEGKVYPWSFKGYGAPVSVKAAEKVQVLTPASTVNALRAGFVPGVRLTMPLKPSSTKPGSRARS